MGSDEGEGVWHLDEAQAEGRAAAHGDRVEESVTISLLRRVTRDFSLVREHSIDRNEVPHS